MESSHIFYNMNLSSFRIKAKTKAKMLFGTPQLSALRLLKPQIFQLYMRTRKTLKKLLVKNKAKLINSLLGHGWGRTGKAQETILVLKKVEKTLCALTLVNL